MVTCLECFTYLLLNQRLASLSHMLLGHLGSNSHLLLNLLLVLMLMLVRVLMLMLVLLVLLLLLGVSCLLHVLQPELGQVNLSCVFAGVTLAW